MPGLIQATWDDAPHLSEADKKALWDEIPEHEREARTKGIPMLGAGRIFPYPESLVFCDPIDIPKYWPKAYGFDADWNRTAALWGAYDRDSDIVYVYSEHYMEQQPPAVHAQAIHGRGEWMTGAMDPATNGKINQTDGKALAEEYRDLGLHLVNADNTVEAGIFALQKRMSAGKLKIFKSCVHTLAQWRIYRRENVKDSKGRDIRSQVVKHMDDLMDALRYLVMTGMMHATVEPVVAEEWQDYADSFARDETTGY